LNGGKLAPAVGRIVSTVVEDQQTMLRFTRRLAERPDGDQFLHGARIAEVGVLRHQICVVVPRRAMTREVERRKIAAAGPAANLAMAGGIVSLPASCSSSVLSPSAWKRFATSGASRLTLGREASHVYFELPMTSATPTAACARTTAGAASSVPAPTSMLR